MDYQINLDFNSRPSAVMHLDLNSCFASVEQQANPLLRGKPIAVAAYDTPNGCILAPSIEAKRLGIKVGMRVKEGRLIYPNLIVLKPDADKYRNVHIKLRNLLSKYTPEITPKSIDEFVLDFSGTPAFSRGLIGVSREIKDRIKEEVGDNLTVSIGLGPNRFLAKTASNLHKPDGLDEINKANFWQVYEGLTLTDLNGIDRQNAIRLNSAGIYSVHDFFQADIPLLRSAFKSILGYYWFLRLRGWEIDDVDWGTKSFGHSYSLPKFIKNPEELAPILSKLVEKTGFRMRRSDFQTKGIHLAVLYENYEYFHQGVSLPQPVFSSQDIYRVAYKLLKRSSYHLGVRNLAVSCFNLSSRSTIQLELFSDILRKDRLTNALDDINDRWGNFVITPALMANTQDHVHDRISFGQVRGLIN
ncbi:MAG: Nucleotidyltransferase/DNA polymerase involved in DNA repair [Candidatus Collierbacteria bacterium GW2011_GWF2_44_15]|uniref:Nucleotidyltransferase/DNA polymerase involved in DNA repair n=1 Tax=Candidatus Collierbacteria bacterium GW2011_GWF2_44_15 TaxID=1618404 RepID=A0A0G1HHL3_9BACT|nr:MAG: Nucleotidyltransferase/DNA polymerase involved in DNA repair [Candidatus Collierbacteria bacterium GW2011_GWF2_44_15]